MRVLNSLSLPPVKSLSSVIQKNFEELHKAVQADGYRVTLVHFNMETEEEDAVSSSKCNTQSLGIGVF